MRRLVFLVALAAVLAAPARAEPPVVVELFTSQGCSACPPADELLSRVAGRDDVIALSLHVDYWDYIGWADSFAQPGFTRRQKAYAHALGKRAIYTPQMIVDGRERIVGPKAMELSEAIEDRADAPSPVDLEVAREDRALAITITATTEFPGETVVQVVQYLPEAVVDIEQGENAGRSLRYINIVTRWEEVARWDGAAQLHLDHRLGSDEPAAVLVQAAGHGPVLAAARAR